LVFLTRGFFSCACACACTQHRTEPTPWNLPPDGAEEDDEEGYGSPPPLHLPRTDACAPTAQVTLPVACILLAACKNHRRRPRLKHGLCLQRNKARENWRKHRRERGRRGNKATPPPTHPPKEGGRENEGAGMEGFYLEVLGRTTRLISPRFRSGGGAGGDGGLEGGEWK
jgi:hypothetical protein